MMTSRGRLIVASAAGIMALVYVALMGLSAGCLFIHAASSAEHGHHEQNSSHAPLCTWSCQATSHSALISQPPSETTGTSRIDALGAVVASTPLHRAKRLHARAPPLHLFS
ncbi:MAG: protein of unknown function [Nitrospira sp.]